MRGWLALVAVAGGVCAQSNGTSKLVGLGTDSSGAVLGGVSVVATNLATGVQYPARTNTTGNYAIVLPVGEYRVEAHLEDFHGWSASGIVLEVGMAVRRDFVLTPG